ncbi:MAG: secretin and TonB N-terminal domain-containing protein [Verrucomicrobia bacterium]|nr:secretin and TonB N-terminal domain-containing protein [Verrucomicrobiota bacterium]
MNRTPLPISLLALLTLVTLRLPAQPATPAPAVVTPTPAPAAASADAAAIADKPATAADAPAAGAPAAPAAAAAAEGSATKGKDSAGRDTLSVDFPDEDIRNILRNVADLFELNIIMPDTLQGKTTIKLRDVTWRQIFESVLGPVGYTYKEDGNIIKIVSNESLAQEPVTTDVFIINYAKAADIQPTVTSLIDAASGGKIVVDTRSNSLIITERPSRMNRIRPIIEQLDRATDQVMIESKFIEVTDSDVKNLGVNWSSLANYQISAGQLGGTFNRTRDQTGSGGFNQSDGKTLTSSAGTNRDNTTTNTASQNSSATNTGSVTSTNGTTTATSTTGNSGGISNTTTNTITDGTTNAVTDGINNTFTNLASLINNDGTGRTLNAVFSASEFKLILSALQAQSQVKIVSNPTIVTLNNSEAEINVGQERPIPRYQYNQQTGNLEVNGFDFKPIGVILRVTPQVNARGFIKLTVAPEVSQSLNNVIFNGNAIPIIDTRKTKTQVSLRDGFTMGIGGLLTASTSNTNNKVPLLGSVPVLGRLFRSDQKQIASTNLIIFITAKTISAEGASIEQVFDSERVRQLQLRREDLPGYRDGSSPFVGESNSGEKPPAKRSFFSPAAKAETKK